MSEYNPRDIDKTREPVKTFDETEVLKSSNTWEFLIFEQLRALRVLSNNLFIDPPKTKYYLINLITTMNHLESLLHDRLDPNNKQNTPEWLEFQRSKPTIFKNLDNEGVSQQITDAVNSGLSTQLQLSAKIEKWFCSFDKALNNIKRINPTVFEMVTPEYDGNRQNVERPQVEE